MRLKLIARIVRASEEDLKRAPSTRSESVTDTWNDNRTPEQKAEHTKLRKKQWQFDNRKKLKEYHEERAKQKEEKGECKSCDQLAVPGKKQCQLHLDRQKEKHQLNKAKGVCTTCEKQPAVPSKTKCQPCLDKQKEKFEQYKAKGLCGICGKQPPVPSKTVCQPCTDRLSDTQKETYELNKAKGVCPLCKKQPAVPSKTLCQSCTDKLNKTYQLNKGKGVCPQCRKQPAVSGKTICQSCNDKARERRETMQPI